ncbi:MAG: aspartyl beta-hydroxylase [Sphingomonadales bacterium]|nr:MAG: aspartyl beta-hydroxylase [Sphingomonadales bacterium]
MATKLRQPAFPDRVQLPLRFDAALLERDLKALEPEWIAHFVPQNYEGEWAAFPLRAPAGETHPIRMISANPGVTEFVDTPALARTPYFREVLDSLKCPLLSVRLMRLGAGSVIKEHRDDTLSVEEGQARLHVPIVTDAAVEFMLNHRAVTMESGTLWYLRLSDPHSAVNRSSRDRIHLVIDVDANDWLLERLAEGQAINASA